MRHLTRYGIRWLLVLAPATLAIGVWLALLATLVVSFIFWRIDYVRPHAAWAVASLVLIGLPLVGLLATTSRRLVRGPRRPAAAGWLLLGLTPLVWVGTYMTDLGLRSRVREPIAFGVPVRTIMVWASSVMDLEARFRYPRWTYGRHAILLDRGETPEPEKLVAEMDAHIEAMASLLGEPVPDCEFPWVRGPLVGHNGVAVGLWALCGERESAPVLVHVDRHEVAHTLITALGGTDHYPPFLLIEGWAESQAVDRDELILELHVNRQNGDLYSLEELVDDKWYYTGDGPVYWQGGPLAVYLMEHYGAAKFFDLYRGVHPRTFHVDCERILGDSWATVESEFWPWVEREVKRIEKEQLEANGGPRTRVILGDAVDKGDWQELVDGYLAKFPNHWPPLPSDIAVGIVATEKSVGERHEPGIKDEYTTTTNVLCDEGALWLEEVILGGRETFYHVTPESSVILHRSEDSPTTHGGPELATRVRCRVEDSFNSLMLITDPGAYLPLREPHHRSGICTIHELTRPPVDESGPWKIAYSWRAPGHEVQRLEIELDPAVDWRVVRYSLSSPTGGLTASVREIGYQTLAQTIAPSHSSVHSQYRGGTAYAEQQTWSPLTAEEQQALKDRVAEVARRGPVNHAPPYVWMRRLLMIAVVGCPVLGVLLVRVRQGREGTGD
jgi:hypothetical protein